MVFEILITALVLTAFLLGKHLERKAGRAALDVDLFVIGSEGISMRVRRGTMRDDIERFMQQLLESEHFKEQRNHDSSEG